MLQHWQLTGKGKGCKYQASIARFGCFGEHSAFPWSGEWFQRPRKSSYFVASGTESCHNAQRGSALPGCRTGTAGIRCGCVNRHRHAPRRVLQASVGSDYLGQRAARFSDGDARQDGCGAQDAAHDTASQGNFGKPLGPQWKAHRRLGLGTTHRKWPHRILEP